MPFLEIKQPKDFVRIKPDGTVTISVSLVRRIPKNLTKIKIFHDVESKKIGLQPAEEGYKIGESSRCYRIKCVPLSRIATGEFYPKWSKEHKMLVFSYA